MGRNIFFLREAFLLLFTVGCFCNNHEDEWTFTFPQSITAVRRSDVEIPCTFTAPADYGEVRIVWYKYHKSEHPIVYSEDPSEIIREYRGRTSLIHDGTNSCSLRITDVTKRERFYPGINEKINSYKLNRKEEKKAVMVNVQGCPDDSSCKGWEFTFPRSIKALKGSCVEIPCELKYPGGIQFTLFWYKYDPIGFPKIFSNRSSANIEEKYKGRTFLVGNSMDSCSLRINDVQEPVEIYPGVNEEINGYDIYNGRVCKVSVIDAPPPPWMNGSDHMTENEPVQITCSVDHTCPSSPPSITWNKPELPVTMSHEDLDGGIQRINSTITYNPSYKDDKSQLECTVTFPNNKNSSRSVTLNITYEPPGTISGILPAVIGVIGLLLLVLLVYWCWRKKCQKIKNSETETSPDATYTALVKRDIGSDYDQLQTETSPDATYSSLEKRDIGTDYDQLKPVNSKQMVSITEGLGGAATEYVNIIRI